MPTAGKTDDLIKIAKALKQADRPIGFQVDEPVDSILDFNFLCRRSGTITTASRPLPTRLEKRTRVSEKENLSAKRPLDDTVPRSLRHILAVGTRHEIVPASHDPQRSVSNGLICGMGFPIGTTNTHTVSLGLPRAFWFLSGSTSEPELRERGVDIWAEWATHEQTARFGREAGDLGPVYGYLWRSFGGDYPQTNGVDQIARLIKEIETNPNSRRLIVTGWNPETCDEVALPPCHTLFQFKSKA